MSTYLGASLRVISLTALIALWGTSAFSDKHKEGEKPTGPALGSTTEREPPTAPEDEAFTGGDEKCRVGLIVKMGIKRQTSPGAPEANIILSHNLKHGFSEVVIPKGYDGKFVKYEPDPDLTGPYTGIFSSSWTAGANTQSASAGATKDNVVPNFKRARAGWRGATGTAPEIQDHNITANWKPTGQPPCDPPIEHDFKVVFAGDGPNVPSLRLGDFHRTHERRRFGGGTRTRVYHDDPPVPRSRPKHVHVPIGIFWEVGRDCCGIRRAKAKVIQFARAAIDGPNGRMGKPWTLDTLDSEADKPDQKHDPTYTSQPRSDSNERPRNGGGGGTRKIRDGLSQWDAPGMPNGLYHRLLHAEGRSHFRQQFLSLLVCRPNPGSSTKHRASFYLREAKVKEIAITTITWTFPGQRGVDRRNPANLNKPTINIRFHRQDAGCRSLRVVLNANDLLGAFQSPKKKRRLLEILPAGRYNDLLNDVRRWETRPGDRVRLP